MELLWLVLAFVAGVVADHFFEAKIAARIEAALASVKAKL